MSLTRAPFTDLVTFTRDNEGALSSAELQRVTAA